MDFLFDSMQGNVEVGIPMAICRVGLNFFGALSKIRIAGGLSFGWRRIKSEPGTEELTRIPHLVRHYIVFITFELY